MTTSEVRQELIEYLRKELVGPAPGFPAIQINKEEMLRVSGPAEAPIQRWHSFPNAFGSAPTIWTSRKRNCGDAEAGPSEDAGETEVLDGTELSESGNPTDQQPETDFDLNLANQYLPSAMGISALIKIPKKLLRKDRGRPVRKN